MTQSIVVSNEHEGLASGTPLALVAEPGVANAPFGRILVLVDSTERNHAALTEARRIAKASGGQVRVIHVREWDHAARGAGRFFIESVSEAKALVASAVTELRLDGIAATGTVIDIARGKAASAIIAAAAEWSADVIVVVGDHSRIPVFTGSLGNRLSRRAACPVLTVPAQLDVRRPAHV